MMSYKLFFLGINIINAIYLTHSMILLTANVEDLRRVAEKFLPEPMIISLQSLLMKIAQEKHNSVSKEKEGTQEKLDLRPKKPLRESKLKEKVKIHYGKESFYVNDMHDAKEDFYVMNKHDGREDFDVKDKYDVKEDFDVNDKHDAKKDFDVKNKHVKNKHDGREDFNVKDKHDVKEDFYVNDKHYAKKDFDVKNKHVMNKHDEKEDFKVKGKHEVKTNFYVKEKQDGKEDFYVKDKLIDDEKLLTKDKRGDIYKKDDKNKSIFQGKPDSSDESLDESKQTFKKQRQPNLENDNSTENKDLNVDWSKLLNDLVTATTSEQLRTIDVPPWNAGGSRGSYKRAAFDDDVIRPPRRDGVKPFPSDDPKYKNAVSPKKVISRTEDEKVKDKGKTTQQTKKKTIDAKRVVGTSGLVKLTRRPEPDTWWENGLVTNDS